MNGIAWAEGDLFFYIDLLVGEDVHLPALGDGSQHEHAFHPGEALADTLAASAAEGKVGEARAFGFLFFRVAHGIEAQWVGVELRRTVQDVLAEEEMSARRQAVRA